MPEPQEFFKQVLDNLYDGVYFVDRNRRITYWNSGAERLTGYTAEQVVGRSCSDNILNHCNEQGCELCKNACPLSHSMATGQAQETEIFLHHVNGHRVPVLVRTSPIQDGMGNIIGAVEIFSNNQNIVRARRRINALETKVFSDPLTGLGNRRHLEIQFFSAGIQMRHAKTVYGLLFLDIDHFKHINNQYGHHMGDRVLVMVANTLRSNVRESDTVVRWGGEEFVALLRDVTQEETYAIAEKLRALVGQSRLTDNPGDLISVTVSIGATILRINDILESAIQRADQLMYTGKIGGRNRVTFSQ
jgi:diguanylate cyclase (GGDEF)-like protein/PAS domain S-box-containing protein